MFDTLILQYLNKLVESEIGDFTSPEAFHTLKIKSFGGDSIKPSAQVGHKLPVKVFTLIRDFAIQSGELPHSMPPTVRAFDFTRKTFVACSELIQGLFQRLWVLDLLTRAKRQICVFHAEVCPNTSTCCWQRFSIYNVFGNAFQCGCVVCLHSVKWAHIAAAFAYGSPSLYRRRCHLWK